MIMVRRSFDEQNEGEEEAVCPGKHTACLIASQETRHDACELEKKANENNMGRAGASYCTSLISSYTNTYPMLFYQYYLIRVAT